MGKLRGVLKKTAKKAAKKAAEVAKVAAIRRIPPPVKQAIQRRREGKTMDDLEQLQEENQSLREDNQSMSEEIAKLRAATKTAGKAAIKKWVRGKLPGEKLIKTDPETGKYEEIDKAEWDSLV